ncbi:hypothetical protein FOL47_001677, partial [Perkinsus chesapeaki]
VIEDGLPPSIVEKSGFKALFAHLSRGRKEARLPSCRTIRRRLDDLSVAWAPKVKTRLSSSHTICVTCDVWTRFGKDSLLGIIAHHRLPTDPENPECSSIHPGPISTTTVALDPVRGSHTAENLREVFLRAIEPLNIMDKVQFLTTDSGPDVKKMALKLLPEDLPSLKAWFPCCGHNLHLVIVNALAFHKSNKKQAANESEGRKMDDMLDDLQDAESNREAHESSCVGPESDSGSDSDSDWDGLLRDHEDDSGDEEWSADVENRNDARWLVGVDTSGHMGSTQSKISWALARGRALVKLTRCSNFVRDETKAIREELGFPADHMLPLDVPTRWNSTAHFLKELIKYRCVIETLQSRIAHCGNKKLKKMIRLCGLRSDDFELFGAICRCLAPFEEATRWLSGSHYSTIISLSMVLVLLSSWLGKLRQSMNRYDDSISLKLLPLLIQKFDKYFSYAKEGRSSKFIIAAGYLNPDTRNLSSTVTSSNPWAVDDKQGRTCVLQCIEELGIDRETKIAASSGNEATPRAQDATGIAKQNASSSSSDEDFTAHVLQAMSGSDSPEVCEDHEDREARSERLLRHLLTYEDRARHKQRRDELSKVAAAGPVGTSERFRAFWDACYDLEEVFELACLLSLIPSSSVSSESSFSVCTALTRSNRAKMSSKRLRGLLLCKEPKEV